MRKDFCDGSIQAALLIAHAGDGKSHCIHSLSKDTRREFFDTERQDLRCPGIHLLNDPSQLDRSETARFLATAFDTQRPQGCRYVAAINRGLLRDVLPDVHIQQQEVAKWLEQAQHFKAVLHQPDPYGRVVVPLDLRTLVPAPGSRQALEESLVWQLAHKVLAAARREIEAAWDEREWAARLAVAFALIEATGHHVTFRETLALTGSVAEALTKLESDRRAFAVLFQEPEQEPAPVPALRSIRYALQRMDPARVATPERDRCYALQEERDQAIRHQTWDALVRLFMAEVQDVPPPPLLPYRYAVAFLQLCRQSAEKAITSSPKAPTIDDIEQTPAVSDFFSGLARVAWGTEHTIFGHQIMPLTTPIQPGTASGIDDWRVLRAAVSLQKARFVATFVDPGRYIERGLVLPSLVIDGPHNIDEPHNLPSSPPLHPSPPLRLDLELFELLCRIGTGGQGILGTRGPQVQSWLEAVVDTWKSALAEGRSGFVTFQTIRGKDHPIPLRPPQHGPSIDKDKISPAPQQACNILDVLDKVWPERSSAGITIALTPAACASGLLQWAGFMPEPCSPKSVEDQVLREALGAGTIRNLRQRRGTQFVSPAFPWSTVTLGVGINASQIIHAPYGNEIGWACATALDLTSQPAWRDWIRHAWARDEEALDTHPSCLLAHQWLNAGLAGSQLADFKGTAAPLTREVTQDIRQRILAQLLQDDLPFAATTRWWLIGTWAAWWLMLAGLQALYGLQATPVLLPWVPAPANVEYRRILRNGWFNPNKQASAAIAALGQAAGFLTPNSVPRNFDLHLTGSVRDLIRLLAHDICLTPVEPTAHTVEQLQNNLLEAGLFVRRGGKPIRHRLPPGVLAQEAPASELYEQTFRSTLQALALLDVASDGATLIYDPWPRDNAQQSLRVQTE